MIKRDTLQRVIVTPIDDDMGGNSVSIEPKETIVAHVSINTTYKDLTQYGVKDQMLLHVVSSIKLDEYIYARYVFSEKMFKVMRQVKNGNEYFSVLMEVNE